MSPRPLGAPPVSWTGSRSYPIGWVKRFLSKCVGEGHVHKGGTEPGPNFGPVTERTHSGWTGWDKGVCGGFGRKELVTPFSSDSPRSSAVNYVRPSRYHRRSRATGFLVRGWIRSSLHHSNYPR